MVVAEPWRERRPNPVWEKRALNMDAAIQVAFRKKLPVRVIVCEGEMRDLAAGDERASWVKLRSLDQVPWFVQDYDWNTGQTHLVRAGSAEVVVLLNEQADDLPIPVQRPSSYKVAAARMVAPFAATVLPHDSHLNCKFALLWSQCVCNFHETSPARKSHRHAKNLADHALLSEPFLTC
jgi:hypothetical protein